jgi:hypothetical protein
MGTGKGTTIHGGEYGITLNPTTETAPVDINGRGSVAYLNPGFGSAGTPTMPSVKGAIGYFDGYLYVCVAADTWVRVAVESTW